MWSVTLIGIIDWSDVLTVSFHNKSQFYMQFCWLLNATLNFVDALA